MKYDHAMVQVYSESGAEEAIHTYGDAGWELVAVIPGSHYSSWDGSYQGAGLDGAWFFFKKRRGPEGEGDD